MIVQITANNNIIGGVEVYENNENGKITIQDKTEALSVNEQLGNLEPINTILNSNENVLDIDISDDLIIFQKKEFEALMGCKSSWVEFEAHRSDFDLGISDDWKYAYNIIAPLKIYNILNKQEYEVLKEKINNFFKYDGNDWNREEEYQYDKLDFFLTTLHPLLNKCLHY